MNGGTPSIGASEYRRLMGPDKEAGGARRPGAVTGRARRPRAGRTYATEGMNRTEARYAEHLNALQQAGRVAAWGYEAVKLRLADRTFYTPDFLVVTADGGLEMHEVKGHWEDDARVKIKVAARLFPWFRFRAVRVGRGNVWDMEEFGYGEQ